jgi:hypothetical protein
MLIYKCDLCSKAIEDEHIIVGFGYERKQLCSKCGKDILKFLKNNKLIKEKNKKYVG